MCLWCSKRCAKISLPRLLLFSLAVDEKLTVSAHRRWICRSLRSIAYQAADAREDRAMCAEMAVSKTKPKIPVGGGLKGSGSGPPSERRCICGEPIELGKYCSYPCAREGRRLRQQARRAAKQWPPVPIKHKTAVRLRSRSPEVRSMEQKFEDAAWWRNIGRWQ